MANVMVGGTSSIAQTVKWLMVGHLVQLNSKVAHGRTADIDQTVRWLMVGHLV